jgi:prepilin-type N-terminal cleavage/methylation domain-containing protein
MTIESKQTQKGFTLIELMIVVAIIGILASIAIPQFSSFRAKAFNSSAISDLHGVSLAQEGLFTDYQRYGATQSSAATASTSAGTLLNGTAGFVTAAANQSMPVNVSNNVRMVSNCTASSFAAATTVAKHDSGDKVYGQESDQAGVFFAPSKATATVVAGNATSVAVTTATTAIKGVIGTTALDLKGTGWTVM